MVASVRQLRRRIRSVEDVGGNILMALQMGWEIPPIPGSGVKIEIAEINPA